MLRMLDTALPRMIAGISPGGGLSTVAFRRARSAWMSYSSASMQSSFSPPSSPSSSQVVAVLYQAIDPPVINGVRKPKKPGVLTTNGPGYLDSGADIAYSLSSTNPSHTRIVTPTPNPTPSTQEGWCFPDTEEGILSALAAGATHLWANTIVFKSHPLQTSTKLGEYARRVKVIGQPPSLVENFDDKGYLNAALRGVGGLTMVKGWEVNASTSSGGPSAGDENWKTIIASIPDAQFPIVAKPTRGRGSHGVKVCKDRKGLLAHVESLLDESPLVLLEEFLSGEEATITVMPPGPDAAEYTSLPPVTRFNHDDGVAPYNGVLAVTKNSRVVTDAEMAADENYARVMRECERVAGLIGATAPIRVDVRRFREGSRFALFDINMKPNMTGPGRPGREDQASLSAIAAAAVGWDYPTLLRRILSSARTLEEFRAYTPPF